MEHFGEQYLVASAGALQPIEDLLVHGVMFEGMNSACVHVIPKDEVSTAFFVGKDDGFEPVALNTNDLIELRAGLGSSKPLVPCKWIVSRRGPKPPHTIATKMTGTWRYTEDGTLRAEQVMRVDRVFVGSKYDDRGTLRVEVDRILVAAEAPAELFHKTVDLPTTVLKPGQMIELVGENRRRVPCTWFVTTTTPLVYPYPEITTAAKQAMLSQLIQRLELHHLPEPPSKPRGIKQVVAPPPQPKRSHLAKRMGAIDIPNGKCGKCGACELERIGCGCDGALDDGCFLCHPEKHERPPCPGS